MASRLSEEFRDRTKRFAASVIRLYFSLPRDREEVRVCGKQLLRSGTSVAAHVREASRARSDQEFVSNFSHKNRGQRTPCNHVQHALPRDQSPIT
ncbi:MAG: four helix bundle protein [Proteobacteria bacterium]|nr:four helix bundle protein [Pseudomonadota bacterium]